MKCPHCTESHPDTFYFCTVTGADLQPWEALVNRTYVERYRLKRLLDTEGRGALFEAETLSGANKVAVKIIHPSAARGSDAADRYIEHAATTGGLGHPHLPDGVEAGRDEGGAPYIVRRFVKGQSLASRMDRSGVLPIDTAVRAATNVLSALVATHAHGMCHLAITPSRIFLTDEDAGVGGGALLMDFGSAALTEAAEVAPYRAPEMGKGEKGGVAADIYSVGASLYETLTGKPPFADGSGTHPTAKSVRDEVPEGVDRALERALAKEPAKRFPDAESFLKALSEAMPAVTAPPKAPPAPKTPPKKVVPKATMLGMPSPAGAAAAAAAPTPLGVVARAATASAEPEPAEEAAPATPSVPAPVAPADAAAKQAAVTPATPAIPKEEPEAARPVRPAAIEATRDSVPEFLSRPPAYKRPVVLMGAGAAVLLVVVLAIVFSGGDEAPETGIEGPSVRIVLRSNVANAVITVDGMETETNPFESRFPKSDAAHTIKVVAPGYETKQMLVRFDEDREIILELRQAGAEPATAAPAPPPLPESAATAPETAEPATAEPATAEPATAEPATAKVASARERRRTRPPRRQTSSSSSTKRTTRRTKQGGGFVTDNPFE